MHNILPCKVKKLNERQMNRSKGTFLSDFYIPAVYFSQSGKEQSGKDYFVVLARNIYPIRLKKKKKPKVFELFITMI